MQTGQPKFTKSEHGDYCVSLDGQALGRVRWYWDGWRAIDLNGMEISSQGYATRKSAVFDFPAVTVKAEQA